MLQESLTHVDVDTYFSPKPKILAPPLKLLVITRVLRMRPVADLFTRVLSVLRGRFLRTVATPLDVFVCTSDESTCSARSLHFHTTDGTALAAAAIAACVVSPPSLAGAYFPDEIYSLDDFLVQLKKVNAPDCILGVINNTVSKR